MDGIEFIIAHPDFYVPPELWSADAGYLPTHPPAGWTRHESGLWTQWLPPHHVLAAQGWKVHVSAQLERAAPVLDVVTDVCAAHGVAFKHVRTRQGFLWLHHKHGPRHQSGKFCTAYPADEATAGRLMVALEAALADERGPYVLTDRRFGSSSVVSYRYGAFTPRYQLRPDGTREPVITALDGTEMRDERLPRFHLPEGVTDPFAPPPDTAGSGESVSFNGYTFRSVLQYSNAGGAYRASIVDGREVFVKEARQDNGYQWNGSTAAVRLRREYQTLEALHAAVPGICPEPLELFQRWEHTFLVTELVPGRTLWSWTTQHNPILRAGDPAAFIAYYDRCRRLLDTLHEQIERLHAAGYVFVDLNPRNVLVEDDHPRLIDFEEAHPIDEPRRPIGAEEYLPPEVRGPKPAPVSDVRYYDEYALAAIAQLLLHPLHPVLVRNPDAAAHLAADIPVMPTELWRRAGRIRPRGKPPRLPTPVEVAEEPGFWLDWLRERVYDGLRSVLDVDASAQFPLTPQSHVTNPYNVAYGLAGIAYAMDRAGQGLDAGTVRGLIDGVTRDRDELPPGLLTGTAGIAWVLAALGHLDAARDVLTHADGHPLTREDATLAHGSTGVALAHLALYRHDGDEAHVAAGADLLHATPHEPGVVTGWREGRPGIALALHYLAEITGDEAAAGRGHALLLSDLEQAYTEGDGMEFRISAASQRVEPYLATGSAGFALVAGRYLAAGRARGPLPDAYHRCVSSVRAIRSPLIAGLFEGLSGMGLVLSDLAALTGDATVREAAVRSARSLFKYAIPRGGGFCFLSAGRRISADLASGGAGVLLFLDHVRGGRPDALFTLDSLSERAASRPTEVPEYTGYTTRSRRPVGHRLRKEPA